MKNTVVRPRMPKIVRLPDFRIDFDAAAALIGPPQLRSHPVMPADLKESSVPLAEISQGPGAFELFLDRNQKNIIILAILVAIGAAALVVYRGIETSHQETAGAALVKAEDLAALQAVVNEHAGTSAAQSAAVLLAERQWTEGQQDAAIETLRKFISSNPDHPAVPTAQASLGSKLMIQGKSPEATKIFQEIVDAPNARFIAPYALISLGDISKIAGDLDKAATFYNRVKTDFSDSSFADSAGKRIANLKSKAPVEIAAPPKPATPPAGAVPGAIPPALAPAPGSPIEVTPAPAPAPGSPIEVTPAPETPPATPPQEPAPAAGNESKPEEAPAAPQQ